MVIPERSSNTIKKSKTKIRMFGVSYLTVADCYWPNFLSVGFVIIKAAKKCFLMFYEVFDENYHSSVEIV